ncbi:MAG TPA: DUF2232 domain-containing protein [Rhodospirillaceae bacterium]|nr:DUF2232 domain-containing protein [Rhodospirillaceae bacterium]
MARGIGLAIAVGLVCALVYLSVLSGGVLGVLLAYVTPLPLVLVGLSRGLRDVAAAAAAGLAVVALAVPGAASAFAVVTVLPALIVVRQALLCRQTPDGTVEWYPPGLLVTWLGLAAAGLMVLATVLAGTPDGGIEAVIRDSVSRFIDEVAPGIPPDSRGLAVKWWTALFPAMLGGAWILMAALNGVLGQWTVTRAGHALRPTPAYSGLDLPPWLLAPLAAAAAVGAGAGGDAGYLARNLAAVLLWPYVFAGLALVHRTLAGRPRMGLLLALFYVTFFAMSGWAWLAVAGLGLVSHWIRPRPRDSGAGQEEE